MEYIRELLILRAASLSPVQVVLDGGVMLLGTVAFVNDNAVAISSGIGLRVIAINKIVSVT
ncbi:hypothetical protein [Paenibacillus glycinis]|uniref:Uncharacterized protein n=1 Tax=Paenibacillus glycinis TaxID=2697035 RepID=A0ABW9XQ59_9BACL|nr:hypothetical protein [Paenibacillus glycinis]NBD24781.1 hypothetical protein [Paenibacillus glycinis]